MKYILKIPAGHEKSVFIVSVSGGKDSAALAAEMKRLAEETGIEVRYVFADTGWEAPETYEYLATMERVLGITIDRVGFPGGMLAKIRERAGFPNGGAKWCTDELKLRPLRAYHDAIAAECDTDTINVIGVRAEESAKRAKLAEWEYSDEWRGYVWRPIHALTIADVLAIHHHAGLPVNPLYKRGHGRVGCYPCFRETKGGIALIAEHSPERIDELHALEHECSEERARRNVETPGRYTIEEATFFQKIVAAHGKDGARLANEAGRPKRKGVPFPIREAVAWSRTSRGGVQLKLIQESPDSGCFRWGMCEPPEKGGE